MRHGKKFVSGASGAGIVTYAWPLEVEALAAIGAGPFHIETTRQLINTHCSGVMAINSPPNRIFHKKMLHLALINRATLPHLTLQVRLYLDN